jgi:hypothetical protein
MMDPLIHAAIERLTPEAIEGLALLTDDQVNAYRAAKALQAAAVAEAAAAAASALALLPKFKVSLNCPTPLAFRELVVSAPNEHQAMEQFLAANGISHSEHAFNVERVDGQEAQR